MYCILTQIALNQKHFLCFFFEVIANFLFGNVVLIVVLSLVIFSLIFIVAINFPVGFSSLFVCQLATAAIAAAAAAATIIGIALDRLRHVFIRPLNI